MPDQTSLRPTKPAPQLNVPHSDITVKVSIIDTTSHIFGIPTSVFIQPHIQGYDYLDCPAFSFLLEHPDKGRTLFDLGVRKDWENLSPRIVSRIKDGGWKVTVDQGVAEILRENGVGLDSINGIVWSHWHWDHTGDPSTFPASTALIVGPGFKQNYTPGYPTNKDAPIKESDYTGRELREIDFSEQGKALKIGRFPAYDYFGDGSFYLLDSPGHAIGHMCGLARTTNGSAGGDTFIFMGGDACHHGGEFRPTEYLPLPKEIRPNPLDLRSSNPCPGAIFEEIHRNKKTTEPFFEIAVLEGGKGVAHDVEEATESIRRLEEFDASPDVFVAIAHDDTLAGVVDFFPKTANGWREKGWAREARWRFLKDFKEAVESHD